MPTLVSRTLRRSLVAAVTLAAACAHHGTAGAVAAANPADGWRPLFDGRTFAGWRGLGVPNVPAGHWRVVDGAIEKVATKNVPAGPDGKRPPGGDIMTDETFGDFELAWEWKVTPGANSGLKYNVSEELSGGREAVGFEYQMIDDDRHPDGKLIRHKTGDLYDLISSNANKHVNPVGEWNASRVVFRGMHGEHWLNGAKVVEYDLGSPAMQAAVAASKFKGFPWFAERRRGHIVLQDHGDEVYFRNIRIRVLDAAGRAASSR